MSSIINYNGDRSLKLDTSECLYRSIDIPSGTVDLRFGVVLVRSGSPTEQSFVPTISKYETFRQLFVTDEVASANPSNYVGFGSNVGGNCRLYFIGSNGFNIEINSTSSFLTSGYTQTGSVDTSLARIRLTGNNLGELNASTGALSMIRLYKTGSITNFEFRSNLSQTPDTISTITDTYFREMLTDLSKSSVVKSSSIDSPDLISEVKSVFLSWPFYSIPLVMPIMGYRALKS